MGYKKAFPQIVTHILQKAFFKHALELTGGESMSDRERIRLTQYSHTSG